MLIVLWAVPAGLAGLAARLRDASSPDRPDAPAWTWRVSPLAAEAPRRPRPPPRLRPSRPVTLPGVAALPQHRLRCRRAPLPVHRVGPRSVVGAGRRLIAGTSAGTGRAGAPSRATPPLRAQDVDVSYGQLQVLFGVDLDVHEGEVVALLGTNGAGKSTILKAICGLSASSGAISLGDQKISGRSPEQIVRDGIALMPGGKAIFPTLSVTDHLRLSCWTFRKDSARIDEDLAEVHRLFPILEERRHQLAGDLSGGEQQQLALAMTLLLRPRVLLIDELSLGLSPMVVAALCDVVRTLNRDGMTIVVVEQSVNVALTLAERAVFMEKGTVRFEGPTRELLERPDLLRSVFIEGAGGDEPRGRCG